jgi:hypothetical protein
MKGFKASPSSQLYQENLKSSGILYVASLETVSRRGLYHFLEDSYVQLLWIYFPSPVTEAFKAKISRLRGMREYIVSMSGRFLSGSVRRHNHLPLKIWATQTELVHGQEIQSMLYLHFWVNAEKAEYRNLKDSRERGFGGRSHMEHFVFELEELGPLKWKEEFYEFKPIMYV